MNPLRRRFVGGGVRALVALGTASIVFVAGPPFSPSADADDPPVLARPPKSRRMLPDDAVNAFLAAAKAKDPVKLLAATAHDAPFFKNSKNKALFDAILHQTLTQKDLTDLATRFDGYAIIGHGNPGATGRLGVIVGKPGPNQTQLHRTVQTRVGTVSVTIVGSTGDQL